MNIACGESFTLLDLVSHLNHVLGTDLEPTHAPGKPGEVKHSMADIDKAREVLKFIPQVSFEEGLRKLAEWWQDKYK